MTEAARRAEAASREWAALDQLRGTGAADGGRPVEGEAPAAQPEAAAEHLRLHLAAFHADEQGRKGEQQQVRAPPHKHVHPHMSGREHAHVIQCLTGNNAHPHVTGAK
jgi:hypothetical protein